MEALSSIPIVAVVSLEVVTGGPEVKLDDLAQGLLARISEFDLPDDVRMRVSQIDFKQSHRVALRWPDGDPPESDNGRTD